MLGVDVPVHRRRDSRVWSSCWVPVIQEHVWISSLKVFLLKWDEQFCFSSFQDVNVGGGD